MTTYRMDHILYNLSAGVDSLKHEVSIGVKIDEETVKRIAQLAVSLSQIARGQLGEQK